MTNLRIKKVMTWSKEEKRLRLFRIMWEKGGGNFHEISHKLTFSFEWKVPDLWIGIFWRRLSPAYVGLRVWICIIPCVPLQIHFERSYGGRFV